MFSHRLLGAATLLALASSTLADVTTVLATVTAVLNATSAAASSAEPTNTITFNAAQSSLYFKEIASYASGSDYAALGSQLQSELPNSIYTKENSIGFAGLSTEYGSSFTKQTWYPDVIAVHTQVQAAIESIIEDVATKLVNATFTSTTATTIRTPTTAAATVTQASSTLAATTSLAVASGSPGTAVASQQSTAAAAQATAVVQQVFGFGVVAAGVVGALLL